MAQASFLWLQPLLEAPQAVWISASGDLVEDAKRDLKGIDFIKYDNVRIHNMRKMNLQRGDRIADRPGDSPAHASCSRNR